MFKRISIATVILIVGLFGCEKEELPEECKGEFEFIVDNKTSKVQRIEIHDTDERCGDHGFYNLRQVNAGAKKSFGKFERDGYTLKAFYIDEWGEHFGKSEFIDATTGFDKYVWELNYIK